MASFRLIAGALGVSACFLLTNHKGSPIVVHALSYGRQVYEDDRRTNWDDNWDCRNSLSPPPGLSKKKMKNGGEGNEETGADSKVPTATRHLILIRHGQYVFNTTKADEKVLTELGRQQAEATGKRLKELNLPLSILHHSTMIRAVQTAQIISEYLPEVPVKSNEILCEGAPIRPEPAVSHWKPEHWQFFQDGARIENAFRHYFHRATPEQEGDSYELLVCHANVIRYFICRALQLPPEAWLRMSIGNCGITKISIRPNGRVSLREMGGTDHLPPDLITFN